MEVDVIIPLPSGSPTTRHGQAGHLHPDEEKSAASVKALEGRQWFLSGLLSKQQRAIITNVGKGLAKTSDFIHNVGDVN